MATKTSLVDGRLDRIEQKIDRLSDAIVSIARAEEKLVMLENDKKFLMQRMIEIDERVSSVEKKTDENTSSLSVIQKIAWIAASTAIASAVGAALHFVK